jgi:Tfp pilus assembly pilus retraction ATPase PilT
MEERMPLDEVYIDELLVQVIQAGHSELHLDVDKPPSMRRRGSDRTVELVNYEAARPVDIQRMIYDILSDEQISSFEDDQNLMFSYFAPHIAKFGVFVVRDAGNIAASFLVMPSGGNR